MPKIHISLPAIRNAVFGVIDLNRVGPTISFNSAMGNAITILGTQYTVRGTVRDKATNLGVVGLNVVVNDKDFIAGDDFLGIDVTDANGSFEISFEASGFGFFIFDRKPDLYFVVDDGGTVLLDTKDQVIKDADASTPEINFVVDMSGDKLRKMINPVQVPGWVGGFAQSNPAFAYPTPDLSSLPMLENMKNIDLLKRQQQVLWPEFSWLTEPGEKDPKRCFQMFAPDISRLGYTNEGRVYSIICPQQGACSPALGSMNVEVTVTGNRGWADEANKEIAADMSVVGKIWFSPGAHDNRFLKRIAADFDKHGLPFPFDKEHAIEVLTFNPGFPDQPIFPLRKGESTDFPIPEFARHANLAWNVAHLGVEIGHIKSTGSPKVDEFNQLVLDIFNVASGNMLKAGNILYWNVWFTAPEHVNQEEWRTHAERWRKSIDVDHGSPDGNGTKPRFFDGSPFSPMLSFFKDELPQIVKYIATHLK